MTESSFWLFWNALEEHNDIPDFLRTISVKASEKDGKICNKKTIIGSLERNREVGIADGMNGFGLRFLEKTENGLWSATPDVVAVF